MNESEMSNQEHEAELLMILKIIEMSDSKEEAYKSIKEIYDKIKR